jgi:hypothetical protein
MSCFLLQKLDIAALSIYNTPMKATTDTNKIGRAGMTTSEVRDRVMSSGDQLWTYADFTDLPPAAVSQALSRLVRDGVLKRVRKGVYYRPKLTIIGESKASPWKVTLLLMGDCARPTGTTAANLLGFTTQNPGKPTYVVPGGHAPTGLSSAKVTTRRSQLASDIGVREAALLEFLRERGEASDMSAHETVQRLIDLVKQPGTFSKLAVAALNEPPRVRAILGAIGQEAGVDDALLSSLRDSLNPYSRFSFGHLRVLRHAKEWQGK